MSENQPPMNYGNDESQKRSEPHAIPTWADNYSLLRDLWNEWEPTPDMLSEVWFRSYDKTHGVKGQDRINQRALRKAIISVRKRCIRKAPQFLDISDAYRIEANAEIAEMERASWKPIAESDVAKNVKEQHAKRLTIISTWDSERIQAAREKVAESIPTFNAKSSDISTWSATYAGLVFAADEILTEKNK